MPKFGKEEIQNLTKVIESGRFDDKRGGFMDQFRSEFAEALEAKHAISGATAMLLMHAIPGAIGAGAGDEIIIDPIVQFHAIACLHNNIVPVWADVKPDTFLMDPASVEKKITKRTKAIWVTHLWGFPAEVDKLREIADKHGIYLLEDCAHALFTKYKGKYVGNWGHIGTFSFNMGKQLPTGEGGMAIVNDDKLAFELNRRIIFGESPEVLGSNYRMTELEAAVGVAQLARVPGYLEIFKKGKEILDAAIEDCDWLDKRAVPEGSDVSPYHWACIFQGERAGIDYGVFKAALRQVDGSFGFGFTQRPGYMYEIFKNPNAYGDKGCPYNCHLYDGNVDWKAGMCPVSEDVIPRLVTTNNMALEIEKYEETAMFLKEAIKRAIKGDIEPLEYTEVDKKVLELVKEHGQLEPMEVITHFDRKGWEHYDEHSMFRLMENLRDYAPYKLSHAGPRKYAYHDLS
ncbi:DegT/DnrJ/EryC1/StrS family aminotransferase [bacterium]|nr:DegT/DnrJ/EryC1/StrS family aminotransferase [bacterium]